MTLDGMIRFFHLLAAMVWIGGMITIAVLVPLLRRRTEIEVVRAVARRFGVVAWAALGVSVATGIAQIERLEVEFRDNTALMIKLLLVGVAASLAWLHQVTAKNLRPAMRGMFEGVLLLLGLAILAAAVAI